MPKQILTGEVVSTKMDKTVVVQVKRVKRHPLYGKNVFKMKKYSAHDAENRYQKGEKVQIRESAPFSKTKHWEVIGLAIAGAA